MAQTNTTRFKLPQWSQGTDPYPGRTGWNNILKLLEDQAAIAFPSGPISSRPQSGTFGRFFLATDQGTPTSPASRLYYDGGTGWVELNTNGGGGPGTPIAIGGSASEGTSNRSARADHVHSLPLATANNAGALSPQHFELLDGASSTVESGMLVRRTSGGNVSVPNVPGTSDNAASKNYVDNVAGTYQATPGTLVRRFDNGHFRVPNGPGPQDAINLQTAEAVGTTNATPNAIMKRFGNGAGGSVEDPGAEMSTANRRFVLARVSRRAWKENERPLPYGLAEIRELAKGTILFDYRDTEDTPESVRGNKDELGAYVEELAKIMPLLATIGEDGDPERIKDRSLIWPVVAAIGEIADRQDALDARLHRVEGHLGL